MWYFVIGAIIAVAQLVLRNPIQFLQAEHPIQGAVTAAVLGAVVYGSILWLIGYFFL
ncbi:hypothetical protein IWQ48_003785 [Labrenzia sp. EL_13]|nr:hypothetical protein [Labrenzia sp. EL_13]